MIRVPQQRRSPSGFTLVELLVVMAVIGILVAGLLTGMSAVRVTAGRIRTQQLITRLNAQLMPRYEGYKSRRLPVDPTSDLQTVDVLENAATGDATYGLQRQFAWRRLWALRELMRMELPDDYSDLQFEPRMLRSGLAASARLPFYSSARYSYRERINRLRAQQSLSDTNNDGIDDDALGRVRLDYASAECLYMIMATTFEDRDLYEVAFIDTDVGDVDGDGMPEFLDAWGEPLRWIRWPAGYVSEMQPLYRIPVTGNNSADQRHQMYGENQQLYYDPDLKHPNVMLTRFTSRMSTNAQGTRLVLDSGQHSAFDPRQVDRWEPSPNNTPGPLVVSDDLTPISPRLVDWKLPERGYNLFPLIFSYGPNREGGLFLGKNASTGDDYFADLDGSVNPYARLSNPYVLIEGDGEVFYQRGQIVTTAESDNISNHTMGANTGS